MDHEEAVKQESAVIVPQMERHVAHDATYHGIHQWFKHVVEHLGWVVICKNEIKINAYKNSIKELEAAIVKRLAETKNEDRKKDLEIISANLVLLVRHVVKDFGPLDSEVSPQEGGAKKRGKGKSKSKSKGKKPEEKRKKTKTKSKSKSKSKRSKSTKVK